MPEHEMVEAAVMERMLKLAQVEEIVARKRTWIYGEVAAGRFPPPDDGLWYAAEINRYIRLKRLGGNVAGVWPLRQRRAA